MSATRIPLFPLETVLFPGQELPLHIFEPRYRVMTQHCIENQSVFGMVLVDSGNIAQTGCSALIVKTLKQYDDGRSDILAVGQNAFRLLRMLDEISYLEAEVEFLDEDFVGIEEDVSRRLENLFDQCHRILYNQEAPPFEAKEPSSFSYHIAAELPLDLAFRQTLLELRSEAERQRRLVKRLADWQPELIKRDHVREKASGNGHGLN